MILCCGEALIDMLPRWTGEGEAAFAPHAGGAVFNTAIALGRLGAPAGLFTGLSTDLFGEVLADALAASGVDLSLAVRSSRPTTLAFVKLAKGQASYAFYDENTAGRMLRPADLPPVPKRVSAMFFGGISLVSEPCATAYEALMTREAGRRLMMIDPNIRPGFITEEHGYRARIGRMLALADIVKLSDEDLRWLEGPGETATLATRLLDQGPKVVFITEGAQGARAFTRSEEVFVPAAKVKVADTVGAGDTFNAGALAALVGTAGMTKATLADIGRDALATALDLGVRAAAVTVSRPGANPPWAEELG